MKTSATGRELIASFEREELTGYLDAVHVPTIGYGHTEMAGGLINYADGTTTSKVIVGAAITSDEADRLLSEDLRKFEAPVARALERKPTQDQFDAMVSLAFNIGSGGFEKSSVVRRFNAGDDIGAADAFLMWNKAKGKVLAGLTRRRNAERALFLGDVALASKYAQKPLPRYGAPPPVVETTTEARTTPDAVQGKKPLESKTVWSQVGQVVTSIVVPVGGFMAGMDWKTVLAIGVLGAGGFAAWAISERMRHSREDGV